MCLLKVFPRTTILRLLCCVVKPSLKEEKENELFLKKMQIFRLIVPQRIWYIVI